MYFYPNLYFQGAYGTAILYRKKDDDSLVVIKEINMHDLAATERQLALNEVLIFSFIMEFILIVLVDRIN